MSAACDCGRNADCVKKSTYHCDFWASLQNAGFDDIVCVFNHQPNRLKKYVCDKRHTQNLFLVTIITRISRIGEN